jgi:hypothetical protein
MDRVRRHRKVSAEQVRDDPGLLRYHAPLLSPHFVKRKEQRYGKDG